MCKPCEANADALALSLVAALAALPPEHPARLAMRLPAPREAQPGESAAIAAAGDRLKFSALASVRGGRALGFRPMVQQRPSMPGAAAQPQPDSGSAGARGSPRRILTKPALPPREELALTSNPSLAAAAARPSQRSNPLSIPAWGSVPPRSPPVVAGEEETASGFLPTSARQAALPSVRVLRTADQSFRGLPLRELAAAQGAAAAGAPAGMTVSPLEAVASSPAVRARQAALASARALGGAINPSFRGLPLDDEGAPRSQELAPSSAIARARQAAAASARVLGVNPSFRSLPRQPAAQPEGGAPAAGVVAGQTISPLEVAAASATAAAAAENSHAQPRVVSY